MAFNEWQISGSSSSFMCLSTTVDDLSYTPSDDQRSRDAAQIEATGRKSWKTIQGRGEAVWPPILEAALLAALEKYQTEAVGNKHKTLGRFPLRNRFIADYIREVTGKKRTPKQVGSRLQQLRDTCKEERILRLISHREPRRDTSTSSQSEESSMTPPPETRKDPQTPIEVQVEIYLQKELWPAELPRILFTSDDPSRVQSLCLSPTKGTPALLHGQSSTSSVTSFLRLLSTKIEFLSPYALILQSTFHVYVDNGKAPIHSENAPLSCVSSPMSRSGWLYSTELVPVYWDTIISSPDMNRYTIVQVLHTISCNDPPTKGGHDISVIYTFNMPRISAASSVSATPRQSMCSLTEYWQTDLVSNDSTRFSAEPPRYYVTSNTRGDLSSHSLGPSHSSLVDTPLPYVEQPTYATAAGFEDAKYFSSDSYDSYAATTETLYSPQPSPPTIAYQWGSNYC